MSPARNHRLFAIVLHQDKRVEKGFDAYLKTYNFNDKQIQILRDMKDIVSANIAEKKQITPQDVFDNPVFIRIIGLDYEEVNHVF